MHGLQSGVHPRKHVCTQLTKAGRQTNTHTPVPLCLVSAGWRLVPPHREGTGHVAGFPVLGAKQTKGSRAGAQRSMCELKEQQ